MEISVEQIMQCVRCENEEECKKALEELQVPNFLIDRIKLLQKKYKDDNKSEIESYLQHVVIPQINSCLVNKNDDKNQKNTKNTQNNQKDEQNSLKKIENDIDENLKKIKMNYKDGIDTSNKDFQEFIKNYEVFFQERCKDIFKDAKEKKADIELREFMIRHNRFVPLFNLRHISPELLEQMTERFSRMKKDPEDIQKEYDKIELTTTEIK